jgi:hypothetical protein
MCCLVRRYLIPQGTVIDGYGTRSNDDHQRITNQIEEKPHPESLLPLSLTYEVMRD